MKKIIFICTGNTCRSPMAQVLFTEHLKKQGLESLCLVESRGLRAGEGMPASQEAQKTVHLFGANLEHHLAHNLLPEDINENYFYVCMTESHAQALKAYVPHKQILVLHVSDPFGGDANCYKACAEQIMASFSKIMEFAFEFSKIRLMQYTDIDAVAEIEKVSFSVPWTTQGLKDGLDNATSLFLVAEANHKVVAYVGANQILDEVYLNNIAVLPQFRNKGIAYALLISLISQCKLHKASFVSLEVRMSNIPAITLYTALGFQKRGQRKNFYSNPTEDGLILTKDLK